MKSLVVTKKKDYTKKMAFSALFTSFLFLLVNLNVEMQIFSNIFAFVVKKMWNIYISSIGWEAK